MTIISPGTLMDELRRYQLLMPEELAQLPQLVNGHCHDARPLARILGQRGWLTIYQINQLLDGNGGELVFGPYQIQERIGMGGLSTVYMARHADNGDIVALKVIRPEVMADPEGRAQFHQEIEAMAKLDHLNIARFREAGQVGDTSYFAMEYIEGTDLGKYVRLSGPLPVAVACDYVRQTAQGLEHAYERNIVHRDIKPVNLFLTMEPIGQVQDLRQTQACRPLIKILDWGLASIRLPSGQPAQTVENLARGVVGTADYLAPEQAKNAHTVDIRGDIYSLGCSFYYLLTGRQPFPGSLMQKLLAHQQAQPEPVESLRNDLPPGLTAVLQRMMAKQPDDRFPTPASLALALAPFVKRIGPTAQAVGLPAVAPHPLRDNTPLPKSRSSQFGQRPA